MDNEQLYTIRDLTQEQLHIISLSLEVYSRLSSGQIWVGVRQIPNVQKIMMTQRTIEEMEEFEKHLVFAGMAMTKMGMHGSYGIFSPHTSDDARIAYHFHRAIEHQLWKDDKNRQQWVTSQWPADIVKGLDVKIEKQ